MKVTKLLLALFATIFSLSITAGGATYKAYVFGFAASFKDSTVYITEIQEVDSAYIGKSKFLFNRDNYSYQLQNYLKSKGISNPTCITSFAKDRKSIEKKYLSLRKKYTKGGKYDIKYVQSTDFLYKGITPLESDLQNEKLAKEKAKAEKKAAKEAEKLAKKKQKMAEKGIVPQASTKSETD